MNAIFKISGKVALVTGGASEIGLEYAKSLLSKGCKGVAIVDANYDLGQKVVKELQRKYGKTSVIFNRVDLTDHAEFEGAFEKTVDVYKQLDIVAQSAAIFDEENYAKTVAINLTATIRGTKLAMFKYLPKYKSGEEAAIVNTASVAGLMYYPTPVYVATKHGVVALGKSFGPEGEKTKIKLVTICQGATAIPLFENSRKLLDASVQEKIKSMKIQPVENLGPALITAIEEGKSGSIWICNNEPVYELKVEPPEIRNS